MGKGLGPEEQREDTVHQHTHKENKGEGGAVLCTHGTGNAMHVKRVAADGTHWQQSLGNRLEVVIPPSTDVRQGQAPTCGKSGAREPNAWPPVCRRWCPPYPSGDTSRDSPLPWH